MNLREKHEKFWIKKPEKFVINLGERESRELFWENLEKPERNIWEKFL